MKGFLVYLYRLICDRKAGDDHGMQKIQNNNQIVNQLLQQVLI